MSTSTPTQTGLQVDVYAVAMKMSPGDKQVVFGVPPKRWETGGGYIVDGVPTAVVEPESRCCVKGTEPGKIPIRARQLLKFFKERSSFHDVRLVKVSMYNK